MSALRRLKHMLLATVLVAQTVPTGAAHASAYMRLQGTGYGAGLGGTAGSSGTAGTTGATGGVDTTGTTGTAGTTGGTGTTSTTGTTGGNTTTANPVTAGKIAVTQNTDGSVTTTTQGTDGTVTKATTQPNGTTTTIVTAPTGTTTETTSTPAAGGGNVTTTATVTSGTVDSTGTVTAHVNQRFKAQFTTTSTGTPVWQIASTAPTGVALSTTTGTLTGAVADQGTYPVQVTDGIVAKPYSVNLNVIPPLGIADARMVLRKGTYYSGVYWPQNVVGQAGETLTPLPNGLVFEPWGYVHGTPTDGNYSATSVSVTLQDSGDTGSTGTVTSSFPVTYATQPLAIADYPDLTLTYGTAVSVPAPAVSGAPINPVFTVQGNLPNGLSVDRATGTITGTPTSIPTATQLVTVTMSDDTGASVTTDPFRVGPAVTGTGNAASEYPVVAEDIYCGFVYSNCRIPYETYLTQSGVGTRNLFSGLRYTYAHPVVTDGTLDVISLDGNTDYVLRYNASTNGNTDWEPVQGLVVASQFQIQPSNSNSDYWDGRTTVRARIGNGGTFPGWEPYFPKPVTVQITPTDARTVDLAKVMPPSDGTKPFTYFVSGLSSGVTFDGAHTLTVTSGTTGILKAQVAVADVAAIPSASQTLTIQAQSTVTAATTYPTSMTGGDANDPDYGVGTYYSNAMTAAPYTSNTVLTYARPTMADATIDVDGKGDQGSALYYDNGSDPNGNTDWEPVPAGGLTAGRFMLQNWGWYTHRLRIGLGGTFPAFLPHLTDARTTSAQAGKPGFVDIAKAMIPVDGTGPFTYTVRSSTDRLDDYPGYTNPKTVAGVANVPGASFDGTHAITFDGTTPQGTYALRVSVSDANGFHSPSALLYLDVQSAVLASQAYPTDIHKGCCGGPDIPTGTAYSENLTREREDGAYGWYVTYAQPTQLDGTIDYVGDEGAPTIYAYQPVIDQWNWVETPQMPVTGPVSASRFRLQGQHDGDGAARLRLGDNGAFPDFLPTVYAATRGYLIGGSLSVPLDTAMSVKDVKGTATYSLSDNTSLPGGMSMDGRVMTGAIADAGPYAPHFAATDSRNFTSRGQALTLTGTTSADPSLGRQYQMSDYPDASVRAGKAVKIGAPTLTGPWLAPRFVLNGTLPSGLAFNADGTITGTPTADLTTSLTLTVTATDAYGYNVTTDPFHLVPYGYVALSDGSLPATYMLPYSASLPAILSAVGSTDGATWKVITGTMPLGVALDVKNGALDGVPVHMETGDPMVVQITSATGQTATANLNIPVTMWASTFDGSTNYVTLPDIASTFGGGSTFTGFTMAAWVNFSNGNCWERVVELAAGDSGYDAIAFGRPTCGYNGLYDASVGPDGGYNLFTSDGLVPQGSWHYVAVTQSGQANTIYVDGVVQATGNQGTPPAVSRPDSWIGRSSFGNDALFGGQMADVQFYNRALSAGELATTEGGGTMSGLIGRYLSTPYQYYDLSGAANNAVPNGAFASAPFIPPRVSSVTPTLGVSPPVDYAITIAGYADQGVKRRQAVSLPAPTVGGNAVNPTFAISPALPTGLALNANGSISGSMTHSLPATTTYTVTAHDDRGLSASTTFTMRATDPPLLSGYGNLSLARNDSVSLAATVGNDPEAPAFTVAPALPAGLSLNANGSVTGTLTHSLVSLRTYKVTLTDFVGRTVSATFTLTPSDPLTLSDYPTLSLSQGDQVSFAPTVGGNPESPAFTSSPALPAGLALNGDGSITGTLANQPTQAVSYYIDVRDAVGRDASAFLIINPKAQASGSPSTKTVAPISAGIAIGQYPDLVMTVGTPFSVSPGYSGTSTPSFALTGTLPPGVTLNGDGSISGTPTTLSTEVQHVSVTLTDAVSGASVTSNLFAEAATGTPVFDDTTVVIDYEAPSPAANIKNLMHAREVNSATTWAVTDGQLPLGQTAAVYLATPQGGGGISMGTDGSLSGFGAIPGVYTATITATNLDGISSSQTLVIKVPMIASHFDGASNILQIPSNTTGSFFDASTGAFTGFTVAGWVNFQDNGNWERIFEFAAGGYGNNTIYLARPGNGSNLSTLAGTYYGGQLSNGWNHVAVTRSPNGTESVYINGSLVGTGGPGIPGNVDRPLSSFGQSSYPSDSLFGGYMCDMVIANRPFTAAEVNTIKQGQYVLGEVGRYLNGKNQGYDDSGSGQTLGTWNGPTLYQRFYPQ